jgi:cholesterol transport system auxiliary component
MRRLPSPAQSPAEFASSVSRLGTVALIAILASACSSAPPPPAYDLTAPAGRIRGVIGGQVLVAAPVAIQPLAGQQILVKDSSGTIASLGDGQWADQLPNLVQARLIHTFENSSQIRAVARPSTGAVADVQLISEIRSFEIVTPSNEAVVEISAKLISDQTGRILRGRIFRARIPVAAIDAANVARTLDEALSIVMLDIVRWVGGSPIPLRENAA